MAETDPSLHEQPSIPPSGVEILSSAELYGDAAGQGELLRGQGIAVGEVGLNEVDAVSVPAGAVGAVETHGLNGCHATVMVVREADDSRTTVMTHFPPSGFLPTRYREALDLAAEDVAKRGGSVDALVRVVNGGRQDTDAAAVAEAFPGSPVASITYDVATFRGEQLAQSEPVSCLAVVDNDPDMPSLRIIAGGHEMELPLPPTA